MTCVNMHITYTYIACVKSTKILKANKIHLYSFYKTKSGILKIYLKRTAMNNFSLLDSRANALMSW